MFLVGSLLLVGGFFFKQINEEYAQNGSNWIISAGKNRKYVSNQHFITLYQKTSHSRCNHFGLETGKIIESFDGVWLDLRTAAFGVEVLHACQCPF